MEKLETPLEKQLWEMLYRSQTALAIMCLDESNRKRKSKNDWPAGQEWNELVGSSQAIFHRAARTKAGIDHDAYLHILRELDGAIDICENIVEEFEQK